MQSFGLKRIVPAHRTGSRAVRALANVYGDDVLVPVLWPRYIHERRTAGPDAFIPCPKGI